MLATLFVWSAAALDKPCDIRKLDRVAIATNEVRVRDVIDNGCPALLSSGQISKAILFELDDGRHEVSLNSREIRRLLRARVPGLRVTPTPIIPGRRSTDSLDDTQIVFARSEVPQSTSRTSAPICYRSINPIPRGTLVSLGNLDQTLCLTNTPIVPVIFDRTHNVTRAARRATSGAYFGALALPASSVLDTKTPVQYSITIGSVTIERSATLLQPARDGSRAFIASENEPPIAMMMHVGAREGVK